MGNAVSVVGNKITDGTASNHINIKKSNSPTCEAGYGSDGVWYSGYFQNGVCYGVLTPSPDSTDRINATIKGSIDDGSQNVFVEGKAVAFVGSKTKEEDTYNLPSGWSYVSGKHTNANGSVSAGSSTVFVNGKAIARKGDTVTTHANSSTTINEGSSTVFAG